MRLISRSSTVFFLSLSRQHDSLAFTHTLGKAFTSTELTITHQHHGDFFRPSRLHMSSSTPSTPQIISIDKSQMSDIIQAAEGSVGTMNHNYVIIDVRNVDEINSTGQLSPVVHTLPLPYILQNDAFNLGYEEFEEQFGFPKPELDQTLVFTCKAGIRAMKAAQCAIQAGYTEIVSYGGGSDEWFS